MYAILEIKGKQYKVSEGDVIKVDRLLSDKKGEKITFNKVLAIIKNKEKVTIGAPYIKGANVSAEIIKQYKDKKIIVFKYKPKKRYRKKTGHRQQYTLIKIEKIKATARKSTTEKAKREAE